MRKLAAACIAFSAAIFLAHYAVPERFILAAAAVCAGAALLLRLCAAKHGRIPVAAAVFAAVGFLCCFWQNETVIKRADALAGREMTVGAVVTDFPTCGDGYSSVYVRLAQDGLPAVNARIYDYEGLLPAGLEPGDEVSLALRFKSAGVRYGEESDYYTARNVFAVGYTAGACAETGRTGGIEYLARFAARDVKDAVDRAFPGDAAPFEKALLMGDKTDFYAQGNEYVAMRTSGLIHVVAVSGLHVSFLVGFLLLILGRSRRSSVLCLVLVWFFVVMTGAGPSTVRAGFMQSMLLLAPIFGRENDGPTSLSLALALLLAQNPSEAGSAALQMSFAAVAGIMALSPAIYGYLAPPDTRKGTAGLRKYVCGVLASSVGATAFTMPVLAVRFGYVPMLGLAANLLCLWAVTLCFCGGFAACALWALWSPAGAALGWLVSWFARYIAAVTGLIAKAPYAAVYTGSRLCAWWLAFAYAVFALTYFLRDKRHPYRWYFPAALSAITLAAALVVTSSVYSSGAGYFTAIDVGQGECAAVMAGDSTVLLDCGGRDASGNAGEEAASYLLGCGRRRVDELVLTHLHADHANGVVRLMQMMPVSEVVLPESAGDDDGCLSDILAEAAESGARVRYIGEDTVLRAGEITLSIYAPQQAGTKNERGLSIRASVGDFDMLDTGDMNRTAEKALLAAHDLSGTELIMAGHHGSKYSASSELLEATGAETAIISVGYNTYGHPAAETIDRLRAAGAAIYRTDLNGNVTVRTD